MLLSVFFRDARLVFKKDELGSEIIRIALPAAMAFAADPVASLIDTAFIGRLGPVEIAAVGVAIAIFNQASKVTIFPLRRLGDLKKDAKSGEAKEPLPDDEMLDNMEKVSDTNSGKNIENKDSVSEDDCKTITISSSTHTDSTKSVNPETKEREATFPLSVDSIDCWWDSWSTASYIPHNWGKTSPAYYGCEIFIGDLTNIILDPIFIFVCRWGVSGAAIAHVLSQYLISVILLWRLMKKVDLLPPSVRDLQFSRFLKNGFLLLARVIAATICVTLAASRAARLGSTAMAAFQICLQVWLTSSLLADGLAVAGQAIIACAIADKDYQKATAAATRVLQMSFILGLGLAVVVGLGLHFGDIIFSKDLNVLHFIAIGIPFVAGTQPINAIAFVFDGVNFGASDFAYSSYSMVLVAVASIAAIVVLSKTGGFVGIWVALTIFMGLRTFAGVLRMGTGTGPWRFLRGRLLP
ncbi:hypothetical protein OIU84_025446 [Salix udensis]|uniref:Protein DETOXIFICATION n=1 Tax=Salix udensis TaxID=889485 RepID=A0AAD6PCN4_9ROSI|nr:hypothetical protein OIU84_025446 [Salix udensis]